MIEKVVPSLAPENVEALTHELHVQGAGFDQSIRERAHNGFGLIIMRERMRAVGGRVAIESRLGQGTTVTAAVPLGRI